LVGQLLSSPQTKDLGIAYVIFAVLDILWSVRLYYNSKEVIERDVIAEAYIDPGASRYFSLQTYNHFCLHVLSSASLPYIYHCSFILFFASTLRTFSACWRSLKSRPLETR
jgi:hypothetical protein